MNFQHSARCPEPHDECVCGANDAMILWADWQNERAADQMERVDEYEEGSW